jgi:hypothetical protein
MEFESTLYRLKVAQIVTLPHAPTSPGACARERAWPGARGQQIGSAEPRAGADAGGAEARAGAGGTMARTLGWGIYGNLRRK